MNYNNLDSQLLKSLNIAFNAHNLLREDFNILPSYRVSNTSKGNDNINSKNKRGISLYFDNITSSKLKLTSVMAIISVSELIFGFLGGSFSFSLRIVLSSKPKSISTHIVTNNITTQEEATSVNNLNEPQKNQQDKIDNIQSKNLMELDIDRLNYIKLLIKKRKADIERRDDYAMEACRYRLFFSDDSNADRLRLDTLATRLLFARKALQSEDILQSRNVYLTRCSDLTKSVFQRGLQTLQAYKATVGTVSDLQSEIFSECSNFLKDVAIEDDKQLIFIHESVVSNQALNNPERINQAKILHQEQIKHIKSSCERNISEIDNKLKSWQDSQLYFGLPESAIKSDEISPDDNIKIKDDVALMKVKSVNSVKQNWGPSIKKLNKNLIALSKEALVPLVVQEVKRSAAEEEEFQRNQSILRSYAEQSYERVQQFEESVSACMSRCTKLAVKALEKKYRRASKSSFLLTAGDPDNMASTSNLLITAPISEDSCEPRGISNRLNNNQWDFAGDLLSRNKQRQVDMASSRDYFENVFAALSLELKENLDVIHNHDLEMQLRGIDRIQENMKNILSSSFK